MLKVLHIKKVRLLQNENSEHDFHVWIFPRYKWMEKIGTGTKSLRPIVDYAIENMDQKTFTEVKDAVAKMKAYMRENF